MRNKSFSLLAATLALFTPLAARAESIGKELPVQIPIPGLGNLEFNNNTIQMTFVVACLICLGVWLCTRKLGEVPNKKQSLIEFIFNAFDGLTKQSLGKHQARTFLPWIGSLFLFIWTSNMMGLILIDHTHIGGEEFHDYNQNGVYDPGEYDASKDGHGFLAEANGVNDPGFILPKFEEPTGDYNVPLGMALLFVVTIGHGTNIRRNGIFGYLKGYLDPGGIMGFVMLPLNIVGKIAEVVSISFRLFGNIFGGSVIFVVVTGLIHNIGLPVPMLGYFGVFAGTVQSFVFTMLALTYISLNVAESGGE